jgi:adenylyltransferase/sulfurtransferase
MFSELSEEEKVRYERHLSLPQIGMKGQRKLKAASVLVVGIGGLGSTISMYLAAAGVGRIGLVDHDSVDETNLQRQLIYETSDIGQPKVESARKHLLRSNPNIYIDIYYEKFSFSNADRIAKDYSFILDGTDNLSTRYIMNDYSVSSGKTYVYGACFQFEGQVSVFDAVNGPCLSCVFHEVTSTERLSTEDGQGIFNMLPGVVGTIQASETVKQIIGIGSFLIGKFLLINLLEMNFHLINIKKNQTCIVCGGNRI